MHSYSTVKNEKHSLEFNIINTPFLVPLQKIINAKEINNSTSESFNKAL